MYQEFFARSPIPTGICRYVGMKRSYQLPFLLVFLLIFHSAFAYYPIRKETVSLTELIETMKTNGIDSEEKFARAFGSVKSDKPVEQKISTRYVYSTRWGWLDVKHIAAAMYQTGKWYLTGKDVWNLGTMNELYQKYKKEDSAFSYEDFTSNMLGIYFESVYIEEDANEKKSFEQNFSDYMKALGVVDNPLEIAPNAKAIPLDYDLDTSKIPHNCTAVPFYTTEKQTTELDSKILIYRKLLTGY